MKNARSLAGALAALALATLAALPAVGRDAGVRPPVVHGAACAHDLTGCRR